MQHPAGPHRYWSFLRDHLWRCIVIFIGIIIEMGFYSAVPFSFKYLVDEALIKHDSVALAWVLSLLCVGAVVVMLFGLWRDRLYALVQAEFIARVRHEMFTHLQELALDYYARYKRIEIMLRFKRDLGSMESYATGLVPKAILPFLQIISTGVLMYVVDWRLGIVGTILWPLTYIGPRRYSPKVMAEYTNRKIQEGMAEDVVKENISAQPVVKAFGLQGKYLGDFAKKNKTLANTNLLHAYYTALVRRTVGIGSLLSQVAVMAIGSYMVWQGMLSIGSLAAFQALFVSLTHGLADFMQNLPSLMQARDGIVGIETLLSERPAVVDDPSATACEAFKDEIAFTAVTFGYTAEQTLISDLSFTIKRGSSVALVGTSGSGKSTILNLLERFYDVRNGGVFIDGNDVRHFTQDSLRSRTGMVFQDPALFEMSVAENIRCGKLDATQQEIIAAAKKAEIHSVIAALPKAYDTVIKENTKLTHEQRQRIALARAIIRKPDLLVLDEATSTLDQHAEASFTETISRLRKEFTVLEVSGHLATTAGMDRIIYLEKGKIVEQGSHPELLARMGLYQKLWHKQSGFTFSADGEEAQVTVGRLREFPLFTPLNDDQLKDIAEHMTSEAIPADRVVVQEGDPGEHFFIIVRGLVEVTKRINEETEIHVASLEDGDYFGEVSLLRNEPRTATIRTVMPTMFLLLHRHHFTRLLESAPGLRESLEANFVQRMEAERVKRAAVAG